MTIKGRSLSINKTYIVFLALAISFLLILGAYFIFVYEALPMREIKNREIKAIAELKINQIAQWHKERTSDAIVNSGSPYFVRGIEHWLNNRSNKLLEKEVHYRLTLSKINYDMEDILIASPNSELLFSLSGSLEKLDSLTSEKVKRVSETRKVEFTDLYKCKVHKKIHYDIVSPLINEHGQVIAALIFRFDPGQYLYPLINLWPLPSETVETIILRREGDSVIFLNDQPHKNSRGFNYSIDINRKERLAVKAVLGYKGLISGQDYKGESVVAYIGSIPNTPWFIVTKISKREVYADIYFRAIVIGIFTIILIIMVIIGMILFYNTRQKKMYKERLEIELKADEALRQSEAKLRASLNEKESLLKEIHHRVKNNLQVISSLLSLQSDNIEDKNLRCIFVESRNRVKTMAIIHEKLYQSNDFSQIDLNDYLTELTGYLRQMFISVRGYVRVNLEVEDTALPIDEAIPVGLIVNELISNSFKYAFPDGKKGEINIKFCRTKDEYCLSVSDNGVGLKEDFNAEEVKSLGLMLVRALIGQLKGQMELNGKNGTHCQIKFPVQPA